MSRQLNLLKFTQPNAANVSQYTSSTSHNSRLCPYCGIFFSSQGLGNHIKTHRLDPNAKITRPSRPGRVKLRDVPSAAAPNPSDQPPDTVRATSAAAPNESSALPGTSDVNAHAGTGSDATEDADANIASSADGIDVDFDDADDADEAADADDAAAVEIVDISSDEDEQPHSGDKKRTHSGKPRAPQLKAHEIKIVLDEWARRTDAAAASNGDPPSKRSLLKWAQVELRRPSLQRHVLNKWINNKDKYLAAAAQSLHVTTRRHQGAPC
eukprot:scaffold37180_cov23-Cyclotella_meneghiniana.AAC.1